MESCCVQICHVPLDSCRVENIYLTVTICITEDNIIIKSALISAAVRRQQTQVVSKVNEFFGSELDIIYTVFCRNTRSALAIAIDDRIIWSIIQRFNLICFCIIQERVAAAVYRSVKEHKSVLNCRDRHIAEDIIVEITVSSYIRDLTDLLPLLAIKTISIAVYNTAIILMNTFICKKRLFPVFIPTII